MESARLPANEQERLAALVATGLLDSDPEQAFDEIVALASQVCGTPMALVSLVDEDRQWFKAKVGLDADQTPRKVAFCAHAILQDEAFVVPDASKDERFNDNPLVTGPPDLRFYAGLPLQSPSGHNLGTLCVLDQRPRELTPGQYEALEILRQQTVRLIALRASRDKAEEILRGWDFFENVSDLVQSVRPDGQIEYVNRAWLNTLGYTAEEAAELNLFSVIDPEDHAHCMEIMGRVLQGEPASNIEARFLTKSGKRITLRGSANARIVNGEPVLTRAVFRDVTETHQLELERDRFFMLSLNLLCIAGVDGRFRRLNPAWTTILGWSHEELLAEEFFAFIHPDDIASTRVQLDRLGHEGASVIGFENRYRHKDGSYRALLWDALAHPADGLVYASAKDITEMRELERAKREFVATVSHELRTPLTAIHGALGLLDLGATGALPERASNVVKVARGSSARLIRLVNDILDIEKIDSGHLTLAMTACQTEPLVKQVLASLASLAAEKQVELLADVTDAGCWADPDRLLQVLVNLVSNAIKFTPDGGSVTLSSHPEGETIRFEVTDQGPGIPPAQRALVFERFKQLDGSDSRKKSGTGLGLAIARSLVDLHGGRIGITDPPSGDGAVFWFELPNPAGAAQEAQ